MKSLCDVLRKKMRDRRKILSCEFVLQASQKISDTLLESSFYKESQHIAYYLSHENEVDLSNFAKRASSEGKNLYLPVFEKPYHLHFYRVDGNTRYQKNLFGIL